MFEAQMCPHIHFAMFKSRQLASSSHASCHRNDGVPFSLALSPPPISVRQGERRYPGRWAEIAPLFAACETGASKPLTVVLMSPHREAQNARLLEGPC